MNAFRSSYLHYQGSIKSLQCKKDSDCLNVLLLRSIRLIAIKAKFLIHEEFTALKLLTFKLTTHKLLTLFCQHVHDHRIYKLQRVLRSPPAISNSILLVVFVMQNRMDYTNSPQIGPKVAVRTTTVNILSFSFQNSVLMNLLHHPFTSVLFTDVKLE